MKKGFTLVELLAVLVILSIISLISFLIVGNTINTSKNKLSEIQIDNIIDAAKVYYLKEGLEEENIENSITETCVDLKYLIDNSYIDNVEIKDLSTKENINASVKIKYSNNKYKYEFVEYECSACKLVDGEPNKEGTKYSCEVKEGTSYNFYVLSKNNDGTTNLIMDQNINSDGTPAGITGTAKSTNASQYNLVAWNNESGQSTNAYGPVTAMTFLYNATKDWANVEPINYIYKDRDIQGTTAENTSYTSFVSTNGVATIIPLDTTIEPVTIGTSDKPLRARMPIYANASITEVADKTDDNVYLYDNLPAAAPPTPIGYWTLSTYSGDSIRAWSVRYNGVVNYSPQLLYNSVSEGVSFGVRPVITVKL